MIYLVNVEYLHQIVMTKMFALAQTQCTYTPTINNQTSLSSQNKKGQGLELSECDPCKKIVARMLWYYESLEILFL